MDLNVTTQSYYFVRLDFSDKLHNLLTTPNSGTEAAIFTYLHIVLI